VRLVRSSGGAGWVMTDEEAFAASRLLARHGVPTSLEGAAALAAAGRAAAEAGLRSAVVVLTGAHRGPSDDPPPAGGGARGPVSVASIEDALAAMAAVEAAPRAVPAAPVDGPS
jgi:hypothetical protein